MAAVQPSESSESLAVTNKVFEDDNENIHNVTTDTVNLSTDSISSDAIYQNEADANAITTETHLPTTNVPSPTTTPTSSTPHDSTAAALLPANMVHHDDDLDPDIDIAAEQIVNEFTEHLQQRNNHSNNHKNAPAGGGGSALLPTSGGPPTTEASLRGGGPNQNNNGPNYYHPDNIHPATVEADDDDEVLGIMSSSLAAGGFEELIMALDTTHEPPVLENRGGSIANSVVVVQNPFQNVAAVDTHTAPHDSARSDVVVPVVEEDHDDDDDDMVEEEIIDSSYDEEEILEEEVTEVEFMDDCDIEEIMEESGIIIAEDTLQSENNNIINHNDTNNGNMDNVPTIETVQEEEDDDDDIQEVAMTKTETSSPQPSPPTLFPTPSVTSSKESNIRDHASVDTTDTDTFAVATTSTINSFNDSLSMDVSESTRNTTVDPLYGDVLLGDMSDMTTRSKTDTLLSTEPSINSSTYPVMGSTLHSRSTQSSQPDSVQASIAAETATSDEDTPHQSNSSTNRGHPMEASFGEVSAVAAAATKATAGGNNQGMKPTTTANAAPTTSYKNAMAPVPPALQKSPPSTPTMQQQQPRMVSTSMTSEPSNIIVPDEPTAHQVYNVSSMNNRPVPPALSGTPTSQSIYDVEAGTGRPSTNDDGKMKIIHEPEMAQSIPKTKNSANDEEEEITEGMNLSIYGAGLLCLLVVFIAVILSVVLTRDKDSAPKDITVPTTAPVVIAVSTTVSPSPVRTLTVSTGSRFLLSLQISQFTKKIVYETLCTSNTDNNSQWRQ
jgi:hypothetical protein